MSSEGTKAFRSGLLQGQRSELPSPYLPVDYRSGAPELANSEGVGDSLVEVTLTEVPYQSLDH